MALKTVPWTVSRPNQSVLKEINPEYSLEEMMLKLKLQYFCHLMWRTDSLERPQCWERLKVGGEEDSRQWDGWMASPTQWTLSWAIGLWVWANSGKWWRTGKPGVLQSMLLNMDCDWRTTATYSYLINPEWIWCVDMQIKNSTKSLGFVAKDLLFSH